MMRRFWIMILAGVITQTAFADDYFLQRNQNRMVERKVDFHESEWTLPEVPSTNQSDWFDVYVSSGFRGAPQILLSSITTAEDGSIRYLLNSRSAAGYDNITAEAMLCVNETSTFSSDGAKLKVFGFADTVNHRWIQPRKSDWRVLGGVHNGRDPIRNALFRAFCLDTNNGNDDNLRARVKNLSKTQYLYDDR